MNLTRKYLQYNDLVIDNYDMLEDADLSTVFKTQTHPFVMGHGSYAPFDTTTYLEEQHLSMTLKLNTRKLSCEQKEHYMDFVLSNLSKPSRIWSVQGKQLLWTFAFVKNIGRPYETEPNITRLTISFVLYEGIWHKTDPKKTFLQPYDLCNYLDCYDYRDIEECTDCCLCVSPVKQSCPICLCECAALQEEYSFCAMKKEALNDFYNSCNANYKITYNCEAGSKIWGKEQMLGQRICKKDICTSLVAGQFYSDTILDSESMVITIIGVVKDPLLTINGNSLQILGEYDGTLTITHSGDIFYEHDKCCNDVEQIDINNVIIPHDSTYVFTVHHGNNSLVLETRNCCDMTCVFVKVDSITY